VNRKRHICGIESCRPRVVVALVVLSLLAFTTIRTSPISAGVGPSSSLSNTTPKQRHFSVTNFSLATPLLIQTDTAPLDHGNVVPAETESLPRVEFYGRYFSLPPPLA
jgi:hypothetical protein